MKSKYICLVLLIMVFCSCNCSDLSSWPFGGPSDFEVTYPSEFPPLEMNMNLVFIQDGSTNNQLFVAFDTFQRKRVQVYDFNNYCWLSGIRTIGNDVYAVLTKDCGDREKRAIIKINIPTGSVTRIPFYDDNPVYLALMPDCKLWIDSAYIYSYSEHGIQEYDPTTGTNRIIPCPYYTFGNTGVMLGSTVYAIVKSSSGYYGSKIINRNTMSFIDCDTLFDVKYTNSNASFCLGKNESGNVYSSIRGKETITGQKTSRLYRIYALEPSASFKQVMNLSESQGMITYAVELGGFLYVASVTYIGYTVTVYKLSLVDYSVLKTVAINQCNIGAEICNNRLWFFGEGNSNIYEVNPDTMECTTW